LPYLHNRKRWRIWFDEIPELDRFYQPMLPVNNTWLSNWLEPGERVTEDIARVVVKNKSNLKKFCEGPTDDINNVVLGLLKEALSPDRILYMDLNDWDRNQRGEVNEDDEEMNRVKFVSMINPKCLNHATILAANFERHAIRHWLSPDDPNVKAPHGCDVELRKHEAITKELQFQTYSQELANRVEISYCHDIPWSKTARDKEGAMEQLTEAIKGELDLTKPHLIVANDDDIKAGIELVNLPNRTLLSTVSNGENKYDGFTQIVVIAAINRKPTHLNMLKQLGFHPNVLRDSMQHDMVYQCTMRTSIRKPNSTEKVKIIVPDIFTANFLVEMFGGCEVSVEKIGDSTHRKKVALTGPDRNRRAAHKRRMNSLFKSDNSHRVSSFLGETSLFAASDDGDPRNPAVSVSLFKVFDIYQNFNHFDQVDYKSWAEFMDEMKRFSKVVKEDKHATPENDLNFLYNLTEYNPNISMDLFEEGKMGDWGIRRQCNHTKHYGMTLDFDGGDFSHGEFTQLFWDDPQLNKYAHFKYNSFNRSPEVPNKFHVVIPFKRPTTSIEEFKRVYDHVVGRIEAYLKKTGRSLESAKLDPACETANQPFYIPGTNSQYRDQTLRDGSKIAFFEAYGMNKLDKYAIDPDLIRPVPKYEPIRIVNAEMDVENDDPDFDREAYLVMLTKEYAGTTTGRNGKVLKAGNRLLRYTTNVDLWDDIMDEWFVHDTKGRRDKNGRRHVDAVRNKLVNEEHLHGDATYRRRPIKATIKKEEGHIDPEANTQKPVDEPLVTEIRGPIELKRRTQTNCAIISV
jgi:hypothetical protein